MPRYALSSRDGLPKVIAFCLRHHQKLLPHPRWRCQQSKEIWEVGIKKCISNRCTRRNDVPVMFEWKMGRSAWAQHVGRTRIYDVKSVQTQVPIWWWTTSIVKHGFQATYCTTWFNYISPSVQVFEFGRWGSRWSPYRAGHWMSLGCVSGIIPFVGCHGQERLKVGICIKNSNQFLKYEGTLSFCYGSKRCQRHHQRSQFRIRRSIPEDPISLNLLPDD